MIETNHAMLQRIAKRYDVPMSLIDTHALSAEPVRRITRMDVRNARQSVQPGTPDHTRQQ